MNKIGYCQMLVKTGDIEGNLKNTLEYIDQMSDCDFIVFPEMNLSGYNCGDLFEKKGFIDSCEQSIFKIIEKSKNIDSVIIVGAPRKNKSDKLYNSAYVIYNGTIVGIYDKQLLANDYHHEDRKYFTAGKTSKVFYLKGIKFGILICEDGWRSYRRDIAYEMEWEGAELLISINYSYFTFNKSAERDRCNIINSLPTLYVNCVGVGDITKNFICYDGGSSIYNPNLENKASQLLPFFHEGYGVVIYDSITKTLIGRVSKLEPISKYDKIIDAITFSIRNIFSEIGIKKAQVHISGGVDSAVVAYLATKALGNDNCVFITQPSKNNGSETLGVAKYVSDKLGVDLIYHPITEYISIYKKEHPHSSNAQVASFEATLRKALGISYTHEHKTGILSCGNHTENALGWNSFGDIGNYCGVLQPIGDLTKTEIFELCEHINNKEHVEIIPKKLYDGSMKPSAELEDSSEDPFDYYLMSHICELIIRYGKTPNEIISQMKVDRRFCQYTIDTIQSNVQNAWIRSITSTYKRAQGSPVLILSSRSFGFSNRDTLINHFR